MLQAANQAGALPAGLGGQDGLQQVFQQLAQAFMTQGMTASNSCVHVPSKPLCVCGDGATLAGRVEAYGCFFCSILCYVQDKMFTH